jgi:hypothetical protein
VPIEICQSVSDTLCGKLQENPDHRLVYTISDIDLPLVLRSKLKLYKTVIKPVVIQGGLNMTGTNCDLFIHKSSRSYLNHLVYASETWVLKETIIKKLMIFLKKNF